MPHGKAGWLKVGTGAFDSSVCCTDDLKASAPSRLGVTGEKADGRGRSLASLFSPFSFCAKIFGLGTFRLSVLTGRSHPTSNSSLSSPLSTMFSSAPSVCGVLF